MNVQSLVVVVLRLTALNFFLRVMVEISTPVLLATGIYQRGPDEAPVVIGGALVGILVCSAILLWLLALPVARLIARGVPYELSLGDLSLADCYSIAFLGMGLFFAVSHLAPVWNWSVFFLRWTFHHSYYVWNGKEHGHELANAFLPFIAGVILIWKRRKWALALAGSSTHTTRVSLDEPWGDVKRKAGESITISIEPPRSK
jgi:hypothetical protein